MCPSNLQSEGLRKRGNNQTQKDECKQERTREQENAKLTKPRQISKREDEKKHRANTPSGSVMLECNPV